MRPTRHYSNFLRDIINACDECSMFIDGMTFEDFEGDVKTKMAVIKEIEIIGEAANRILKRVRQAAPEVPGAAIAGMRNKLTYEFFAVNYRTVWFTAKEHLPLLRQSMERLVGPPNG